MDDDLMPEIHATSSAVIAAPPQIVYGLIAEGVAMLLLTLLLNGALWGAVIGATVALGSLGNRKRIRPQS